MKTIVCIKRALLAVVVALSLGLALVPRAEASVSADCVLRSERAVHPDSNGKGKDNDGQETHG
jgi:hypothetical protein